MKTRPTQIAYHEWNIAGQARRVRRHSNGFEFWMSKWHPFYWLFGPRGRKLISDDQIRSITHWPHVIIVNFDTNDEILLRDEVLRDLDPAALPYPIVNGDDTESSAQRLRSMRLRQRQRRGATSWGQDHVESKRTSSWSTRTRKSVFAGAVVAVIVTRLVTRW